MNIHPLDQQANERKPIEQKRMQQRFSRMLNGIFIKDVPAREMRNQLPKMVGNFYG
jgi:hypothetical protein